MISHSSSTLNQSVLHRRLFYQGVLRFNLLVIGITAFVLGTVFLLTTYRTNVSVSFLLALLTAVVIAMGGLYAVLHRAVLDTTLRPLGQLATKGQIAERVAHDVRGPLTSLRVVIPHIRAKLAADPDLALCVAVLTRSTQRLSRIADDLLNHSSEGEPMTAISLHAILDTLIEEYIGRPDLSAVRFHRHYHREALSVHGRSSHVERIFGNLLNNAIEAIDFAGTVTVHTAVQEDAVIVSIQDTGPGLSEEKIHQLLTTSGFTEGKSHGHGIGLTFVKEILGEHGGHLTIRSQPGSGATFECHFPCIAAANKISALRTG